MLDLDLSDLSTLSPDLAYQWNIHDFNYMKTKSDEFSKDGTFEDFLHANLSKDAKTYIYERECPFVSKDTLNAYFGNIAFIQHTANQTSFNVRLIADCSESRLMQLVAYYDSYGTDGHSRIKRVGLLRNFFAEGFDPFQETMKRILEIPKAKEWMKKALNPNSTDVKKQEDLVFAFAKGQLIAII